MGDGGSSRRALLLSILLSVAGVPGVSAQAAPTPAAPDTIGADTLTVSARGALLRSLVIPGWGQAYVGAPGRGALYFAMEAGSLWMVQKSRRARAASHALEAAMHESGDLEPNAELPLARSRGNQVEDWISLSVFLLFFSGADAYVSAQLSDFTEHIGVLPTADGALRLEAQLPLSNR